MHIAASNPLAIKPEDIDKKIVEKEEEIIKAEIINSGKPAELADKISKGKITKFLNENFTESSLTVDPKKKVKDNEENSSEKISILNSIKYKVGEESKIVQPINYKNYSSKMEKSIQSFKKDISTLRTGRANINMLDTIKVGVYGQLMPIQQLSTVSVPEARLISVQVWDKFIEYSIDWRR